MVAGETGQPVDLDAEFSAIVACNEMVMETDNEVQAIAKSKTT